MGCDIVMQQCKHYPWLSVFERTQRPLTLHRLCSVRWHYLLTSSYAPPACKRRCALHQKGKRGSSSSCSHRSIGGGLEEAGMQSISLLFVHHTRTGNENTTIQRFIGDIDARAPIPIPPHSAFFLCRACGLDMRCQNASILTQPRSSSAYATFHRCRGISVFRLRNPSELAPPSIVNTSACWKQ